VDEKVARAFTVAVEASADRRTLSAPTSAWAEIGSVACTTADGPGPYTLQCTGAARGDQTLTVHVVNANGVTTDVPVEVWVRAR
jgi:hypothetical protein